MLIQNSTFVRASWREWTMNVLICDDDPLTIEQIHIVLKQSRSQICLLFLVLKTSHRLSNMILPF